MVSVLVAIAKEKIVAMSRAPNTGEVDSLEPIQAAAQLGSIDLNAIGRQLYYSDIFLTAIVEIDLLRKD